MYTEELIIKPSDLMVGDHIVGSSYEGGSWAFASLRVDHFNLVDVKRNHQNEYYTLKVERVVEHKVPSTLCVCGKVFHSALGRHVH